MLLGAWFLWQALLLREGPGYAAVGPRVFPLIAGLGFALSGLALLWTSRGRAEGVDEPEPLDTRTLGALALALAGYVLLFRPLGFVASSALFLLGGSRVLGSRSLRRDLAVAVALPVVVFLAFTRLLGLELP